MTGTSINRKSLHLLRGAGTVALGCLMLASGQAQRPVLNVAATHTSVRPVVAQLSPDPAAPNPPQAAQSTPPLKDDLFAGTEKFAKGATDVTEVSMDPNSLDLVNGPDANRAHRMVLNVVRTYSYDKPGMYNPADVDEYRHKLETGDWHCSVHTRDLKSGDSTDVCSRNRPPDMVENAIITASPKSLTFIHNIRKAKGQGSGLDLGGASDMSLLPPGVPFGVASRVMQAVMAAEFAGTDALLRAEMLGGTASLQTFHFGPLPDVGALSLQLEDLKPFHVEPMEPFQGQLKELQKSAPELREEMRRLQDQLNKLQKEAPQQP